MRKFIRFICNYLTVFVIFSIVFVVSFQVGIFSSWILFYRGVLLLGLSSFFSFVVIYVLKAKLSNLGFEDVLGGIAVSASLHLCFFIVVPVTIDRSQTTFLIQILERENRPISKLELESIFTKEYIYNHDAIGRRIDEQIRSRNFVPSGDGFVLTPQGHQFLTFSRLVLKVFGIKSEVVE